MDGTIVLLLSLHIGNVVKHHLISNRGANNTIWFNNVTIKGGFDILCHCCQVIQHISVSLVSNPVHMQINMSLVLGDQACIASLVYNVLHGYIVGVGSNTL